MEILGLALSVYFQWIGWSIITMAALGGLSFWAGLILALRGMDETT